MFITRDTIVISMAISITTDFGVSNDGREESWPIDEDSEYNVMSGSFNEGIVSSW